MVLQLPWRWGPVSCLRGTGWRGMEGESQHALKKAICPALFISSSRPATTSAAVSGPVLFLDAGPPCFGGIKGQSAMGLSNPTPLRSYTQSHMALMYRSAILVDLVTWGMCRTTYSPVCPAVFNQFPGYIIMYIMYISHALRPLPGGRRDHIC